MAAKKLDFTKIALIGGGLWLGNKLLTKDPETVQAFSAASVGGGNVSDIEALKTLIKTDPQIRALLKGDSGAAGADGADGVNGDTFFNFGASLIRNSTGELGNSTEWSSGSTYTPEANNGVGSIRHTASLVNNTRFGADKTRLLKIDGFIKSDGTVTPVVYTYRNGSVQAKEGGSFGASNGALSGNGVFQRVTKYIGGIGSAAFNVPLLGDKYGVNFSLSNGGYVEVSGVVVQYVNLGEPVPYTLPWLPSGQMVQDPATGDVGRYDGTAVTWFATAP